MFRDLLSDQNKDYILNDERLNARIPALLERDGYVSEAFIAWQKVDTKQCNPLSIMNRLREMHADFLLSEQEQTEYLMTFSVRRNVPEGPAISVSNYITTSDIRIIRHFKYNNSGLWTFLEHRMNTNTGNSYDIPLKSYDTELDCRNKMIQVLKLSSFSFERNPSFIVPEAEVSLRRLLMSGRFKKEMEA